MPLTYDRHWLLTWTTYGTWLPGDARGFVSPIPRESGKWTRENRPGVAYDRDVPERLEQSRQLLKGPPVFLRLPQAELLLAQFRETARHRGWGLLAAAVMRCMFIWWSACRGIRSRTCCCETSRLMGVGR